MSKEKIQILKEKIEKLNEEKYRIELEIEEVVKSAIPGFGMWNTIGTWDCENSPIGVCVYNHIEDPALDDCLFCGGPDERK